MNRFQKLAVPGVQSLKPYIPGKPIDELERELGIKNSIKLASNENPLGPSPKALAAAQDVLSQVHHYPDGSGHKLVQALAEKHGVNPRSITLGNGSNDVLEIIARAFLAPCNGAVYSEYAFAVYPIVTQAIGAEHQVAKAYSKDHPTMPYGHDLDAMAAKINNTTRLVFIANPNNPTGTWLDAGDLETFIKNAGDDVLVVLDEAYYEYMPDDLKPDTDSWLQKYPNLIVTRTFSKIYGLAGLRIGYAVSHPDVADVLNRVRQPFNTNMLAQAAALAALDDLGHIGRSVQMNTIGLNQLADGFQHLGLHFITSIGNFITVDLARDAAPVYDAMLREGVIVRPLANYNMTQHLRVTVGSREQNARCLDALEKVLSGYRPR
jgi:histidinol-phosphate aminotransferase